jgi:hypothetical protein
MGYNLVRFIYAGENPGALRTAVNITRVAGHSILWRFYIAGKNKKF